MKTYIITPSAAARATRSVAVVVCAQQLAVSLQTALTECQHATSDGYCTVKNVGRDDGNYMDASALAPAWGAVFMVDECYCPTGSRSWYRLAHSLQAQWDGRHR